VICRVIPVMIILAVISGHTKARLHICGSLKGSDNKNKVVSTKWSVILP